MSRRLVLGLLCAVLAWGSAALAHELLATHLGNHATRFAPPLKTPEDLRRTLLSPALQADVIAILRQSNYLGDLQDFRDAVAKSEVREIHIPPGTLLTAMSTRRKGKAILLHQVRWAGTEPIAAYAFDFESKGHRYRLTAPKPCSNFWVEKQLPPPAPILTLNCVSPAEQPLPRAFETCQRVGNSGNAALAQLTLTLPIPAATQVLSSTGGAELAADRLTWQVRDLAPGGSQLLCATLVAERPGVVSFLGTAVAEHTLQSACSTRVYGIPAVLLEVVDQSDPVMVGNEVVYVIRVLNQGSEALRHVRVVATLEDSQSFLAGSGPSEVTAVDSRITVAPILLEPKAEAVWRISVKALKAADVRFAVELQADQFARPINETEATRQY